MNKYNYDVNATISIKDTNVPQVSAAGSKESKENLKFIENYDILLAQERKQTELMEKKQPPQSQQQLTNSPVSTIADANKSSQVEVEAKVEKIKNYLIQNLIISNFT